MTRSYREKAKRSRYDQKNPTPDRGRPSQPTGDKPPPVTAAGLGTTPNHNSRTALPAVGAHHVHHLPSRAGATHKTPSFPRAHAREKEGQDQEFQ
jgi:hypothetical protein